MIKGINKVIQESKNIIQKDRSTWIELYYSFSENAVNTSGGKGFYKVTDLILPNNENDIIEVVERFKRL